MMKIINLYFYTWSKYLSPKGRGQATMGASGFFPLILVLCYMVHDIIHAFIWSGLDILSEYLITIGVVLTIPVFFYYLRNGRGEKIIDYYEQSHLFDKWWVYSLSFGACLAVLFGLFFLYLFIIDEFS